MNKARQPVLLVIRDGWGKNPHPEQNAFNAIHLAILAMVGSLLSGLAMLAFLGMYLLSGIKMIGELNGVTKSNVVQWWALFVPIYSIYIMWIVIPAEMAKAKQMVGVQQPARGIIVYVFFWLYAAASDLNDIAKAMPPG